MNVFTNWRHVFEIVHEKEEGTLAKTITKHYIIKCSVTILYVQECVPTIHAHE